MTSSLASAAPRPDALRNQKDPRELLARWADDRILDPQSPRWESETAIPPRNVSPAPVARAPFFPLPSIPAKPIEMPQFPLHSTRKTTNWVSATGQIFAYLGVGTLTIGTVMVLVSYFGGQSQHAPTGWLITTAGQMLLFLGVVTLVSGGMEQTTQEVVRQIDTLSEKIVRIEQHSHTYSPAWNSVAAREFASSHSRTDSVEAQLRDHISRLERQLQQR